LDPENREEYKGYTHNANWKSASKNMANRRKCTVQSNFSDTCDDDDTCPLETNNMEKRLHPFDVGLNVEHHATADGRKLKSTFKDKLLFWNTKNEKSTDDCSSITC